MAQENISLTNVQCLKNMHNPVVGGTMINVLPVHRFNHCFYSFLLSCLGTLSYPNGYTWQFMWLAQNTGKYVDCLQTWKVGHIMNKRNPNPASDRKSILIPSIPRRQNLNVSIVSAYTKTEDKPTFDPVPLTIRK